jgi:Family of unknown function (DUF5670)
MMLGEVSDCRLYSTAHLRRRGGCGACSQRHNPSACAQANIGRVSPGSIMAGVGKELTVLSTLLVVVLVLWLLGISTSYTLGGLIHVLLVVAAVVVLLRVIQGRSLLRG